MIKDSEKKRRREFRKHERRKLRRRYALLGTLPFPDAPLLLGMEPYFTSKDSFELVCGPLARAHSIARQLNELALVFNGETDHRDSTRGPHLNVPSPSRVRHRKARFPMSLFDEDSIPSRLYELKVHSGQIERAEGRWIAIRRPHLASLVGEQHLRRKFRRSEYLLRANGTHLEVFSITYRPLFCYRLKFSPFTAPSSSGDTGHEKLSMLKAHERAALIPAEPRVPWYCFLKSRFVETLHAKDKAVSLAITVQTVQQHSPFQADIVGWMEFTSGSAHSVVLGFVGQLNLESREFSIRQDQSGKNFTGQFSENGLVMTLHEAGSSKPIRLVHEQTLGHLI